MHPRRQLPFAGHPTLGSAHAWLERGGTPKLAERLIQECAAGLVEVRRRTELLSFAAPPTRRSGDIEEKYLHQIVGAFGIDRDQVVAHQWVDNGPGWPWSGWPPRRKCSLWNRTCRESPTRWSALSARIQTGLTTRSRCARSHPAPEFQRTRYAEA